MDSIYADSETLPLLFWACASMMLMLAAIALHQYRTAWALPSLAVLGTTFTWYLGDILYSGIGPIAKVFPDRIINRGLEQILLFVVAYGLMVRGTARWFVREHDDTPSLSQESDRFRSDDAQDRVATALWFVIAAWAVLFLAAQIRTGFHLLPSLFPPLAGYRFDLWERERLGGSIGYLLSAGYYLHLFLCAMFGALFVLASRLRNRIAAGFMMLLSWPFWLFGHGRNTVLVLAIPAACGYMLFSRQRLIYKIAVILVLLSAVNVWFKLVIATRDQGVTEALVAIVKGEASGDFIKTQKHLGLDMFKELCYINTFIEKETYEITWGRGYFAEAINFIPRAIWPDKPTIGMDYSKARGAKTRGWGGNLVSVVVTTGMIGQGITNFGYILGPICAAFLMALWSGILASFWTQRQSVMRTCLFLMGLGLTFNTGRDITLLVFFPFIFGYLLVRIYERNEHNRSTARHAA